MEKSKEIAVRNRLDIHFCVSTGTQDHRQVREVGDRVHVGRTLLAAEGAVQIRPDRGVPRVAGYLTDCPNT